MRALAEMMPGHSDLVLITAINTHSMTEFYLNILHVAKPKNFDLLKILIVSTSFSLFFPRMKLICQIILATTKS